MNDKLDIFEILGAENKKTDKKDQGQSFVSDPDFNEAIKQLREQNNVGKSDRKVDVTAALMRETKEKPAAQPKYQQPKLPVERPAALPEAQPVKLLAEELVKPSEQQPVKAPVKQSAKKAAKAVREKVSVKDSRILQFLKEEHVAPSKKKQMLKGLTSIAVLLLIFTFVINVPKVSGSSMEPCLENGDRIVINLLARDFETGDIIVFKSNNGDKLVKRIVASDGDVVLITKENGMTINGEPVVEEYIYTETAVTDMAVTYPVIVDGESYFVLGDNRSNSKDSRNSEIGLVHKDDVIGKVIMCIRRF